MQCHYTECDVLFIIMQNVAILSVIMLHVIMLSVVAPLLQCLKVEGSSPSSGTRAEEYFFKVLMKFSTKNG
jgi:hypothetical protein